MALRRRGKRTYGDGPDDLRAIIADFSRENGYVARHFAEAACGCGGRVFRLLVDEDEGAAVRHCVACGAEHPIGDSAEYLDEAELSECACPCKQEAFEITVGVALYRGTEDVRWLYLGCRCPACGLVAVYADWKNEYQGYRELLERV